MFTHDPGFTATSSCESEVQAAVVGLTQRAAVLTRRNIMRSESFFFYKVVSLPVQLALLELEIAGRLERHAAGKVSLK